MNLFKPKSISFDKVENFARVNFIDYQSPIEVYLVDHYNSFRKGFDAAIEDEVFKKVIGIGVEVDKAELMKALLYDRNQYGEGYANGVKAAVPKWISVEESLPEIGDLVLVIANGNPKENIELINAVLIAYFWGEEGWIADGFDGWDKLKATHWMPLPEPPKEKD